MSDTGFVIAGSATDLLDNSNAWNNVTNILADDGNYANINHNGDSNTLKAATFGLSLPAGATITGIETQHQLKRTTTISGSITSINVAKSDSTLGTAKTPGTALTSSDLNYTAGGDGDLWGLTWTVSDIQASTFQTRLVVNRSGSGFIFCDAAWVKVYYTASTGAKSYGVVVF